MVTYLDRIVAEHRRAAERDERRLSDVVAEAAAAPDPRPFVPALAERAEVAVIAEIKRRSPSRGDLAAGLDPADLARRYEAGGAACLSVLTDAGFFGGSSADLAAARAACSLPVLRKDFTVDERDVADARAMGADAVLLIVAVLDDDELRRFLSLSADLGLAALVEVHDEVELGRAVEAGASVIGVNQRDLVTFEVDRERALRLAALMPERAVAVAESGIQHRSDVEALAAAGYHAVLVGESVVTAADPKAAVTELRVPCS